MEKIQNTQQYTPVDAYGGRVYGNTQLGSSIRVLSELTLPNGDLYQRYLESVWGTRGGVGKSMCIALNGKEISRACVTDPYDRRWDNFDLLKACQLRAVYAHVENPNGSSVSIRVESCQEGEQGFYFRTEKIWWGDGCMYYTPPGNETRTLYRNETSVDASLFNQQFFDTWCQRIAEENKGAQTSLPEPTR